MVCHNGLGGHINLELNFSKIARSLAEKIFDEKYQFGTVVKVYCVAKEMMLAKWNGTIA